MLFGLVLSVNNPPAGAGTTSFNTGASSSITSAFKSTSVVGFDGSSGNRDVVQRIGRALRIDENNPEKVANVIDFISLDKLNGSDNQEYSEEKNKEIIRLKWLKSIAKNYTEIELND